MKGLDSRTTCPNSLSKSRLLRLRPGALPDPSTSLSLTLVSTRCPYLSHASSSLQCSLCVACWMMHRPLWSHHDTCLGHRVARWAPLEGCRFACHNVRFTTYSLHSMIVTSEVIQKTSEEENHTPNKGSK